MTTARLSESHRRRILGAPLILVRDTFTDADTTELQNHTPDLDRVGGGWTAGSTMQIIGNRLTPTTTTWRTVQIDTGKANVEHTCTFCIGGHDKQPHGPLLRYASAGNYWVVEIQKSGSELQIQEWSSGSPTVRATTVVSPNLVINGVYALVVTAAGTTITATLDGGNQVSYASATAHLTATIHGFYFYHVDEYADDLAITEV